MSRDLDTRGRHAASNLKATMASAELHSTPPGAAPARRPLVAALRPALVIALLTVGSAVGLALVLDSPPTPTTLPPATTTATTVIVTTVPSVAPTTAPAPPTTRAPAPPPPPPTTVPADTEAPILEITSPEQGTHLQEKTVTFAGMTEPGARVFAGRYEADVRSSGEWQIVLILSQGKNVARFTARDAAGNESQATVTVYFDPPEPTTTTTVEKEKAAFAAFSTYSSCSETPPFDVYYGTGEPGSMVNITSEYGSAEVQVGENGGWEKKVYFETAPPGTPFLVHVSDQFGRKKDFEFVYTP